MTLIRSNTQNKIMTSSISKKLPRPLLANDNKNSSLKDYILFIMNIKIN